MTIIKHLDYYTNVFKMWVTAEAGRKPTEAELSLAHVFGRPGKQSLAVAMGLRDAGVTGNQIKLVSGWYDGKPTPQLNHMRSLVAGKLLTRENVPGCYKLVKGPDADAFIALHGAKAAEKASDKASKPVKTAKAAKTTKKAKGAVKAKGATPVAATVETLTSEAAAVNAA